jgi:hypothetical protein
MVAIEKFSELVGKVAHALEGKELGPAMEAWLNDTYPAGGKEFSELKAFCTAGEKDGWLMAREAGGIKFSRPLKPGGAAGNFSVDVVRMRDVRGPHHIHTSGEIGAIMAIEGKPLFDGMAEGWYVYGPGTDHYPTVSGGDAYILYLLPEGKIEFTGK